MRCFLACFGFTKKRKKGNSSISDKAQGSYQPLDAFLQQSPRVSNERLSCSVSSISGKQPSKTRKKVRFNLNVQAYEPIPPADSDFLESDEGEIIEQKEKTPVVTSTGSDYPLNYRYQNCRDSSDEEDELLCDSDLEFECDGDEYFGDDETGGDGDRHDWRSRNGETVDRSDSVRSSSQGRSFLAELADDRINHVLPLSTSTNVRELCTARPCENARFRSNYVHSVLNPVENTAQWKTVKAKAALPNRKPYKENIDLEREPPVPSTSSRTSGKAVTFHKSNSTKSDPWVQDVMVNTSLSNWLVPSSTEPVEKAYTCKRGTVLDTLEPSEQSTVC